MSAFHETLMNLPQVPTVIISVALMLFSGFLLTRSPSGCGCPM